MALMLGSDVIPYQMEILGNESEKPHLPRVLERIREEKGSRPKIIQVADKGLRAAKKAPAGARASPKEGLNRPCRSSQRGPSSL